jgi:hypothetical protein
LNGTLTDLRGAFGHVQLDEVDVVLTVPRIPVESSSDARVACDGVLGPWRRSHGTRHCWQPLFGGPTTTTTIASSHTNRTTAAQRSQSPRVGVLVEIRALVCALDDL